MSLDIPSGIILLWPGANGSIPSGFSRNNDLNDKFPLGAASGANGGSTGGGTSHTHGTSHSHGSANHTHTMTTPPNTGSRRHRTDGSPSWPIVQSATHDHTHGWTSSTGSVSWSGGGGFGSGNSEPSYYNMIFIESDGTPETYPTNCVVMRNDASGVTGWTQHSGSKSRYIQGAGSGGNGGGTGGGSHYHSMGGHGHSFGAHPHTTSPGTPTGNASAEVSHPASSYGNYRHPITHYHKLNIPSGQGATSSGSAPSMNNSSTTPTQVYHYLWGLEKTSSSAAEDEGMIVLWDGTVGNIPEDWLLCDGSNSTPDLRNRFLRMANSSGEVGGTGGSNSHSHGGGSHSHSSGSHNHTNVKGNTAAWPTQAWGIEAGAHPTTSYSGLGTNYSPAHIHTYVSSGWTTDSTTTPCPSGTATSNSVDATPPYRTVLYLFSPEGEEVGGNVGMFGSSF